MTLVRSDQARCPELLESENALLWCMRAWVIGYCADRRLSDRIEAALARLGAAEAVAEFDGFMRTLGQGARRTIEINCVCYPDISNDERRLLDSFAYQQREDHEEAYAIISHLLIGRAATIACERAQRLALAFAAAGRIFPRPSLTSVSRTADFVCAGMSRYLH